MSNEWFDEHGACKVCGGEIPDGHMADCAYYVLTLKLDASAAELDNQMRYAAGALEEMARQRDFATDALAVVERRRDELLSRLDGYLKELEAINLRDHRLRIEIDNLHKALGSPSITHLDPQAHETVIAGAVVRRAIAVLKEQGCRLDSALPFVRYIAKRYEEGWDEPITERFYNEAMTLLGGVVENLGTKLETLDGEKLGAPVVTLEDIERAAQIRGYERESE